MRTAVPLRERVLSRLIIDEASGCLLWQGSLRWNGYATVTGSAPSRRSLTVHRLMYEWFVGPIPDGLQLDHLCRVRRCAAPAHLEAVTPRENVLRGSGIAAINAAKTHCVNGHPFDEANTYVVREGRKCRACHLRVLANRRRKTAA